MKLNCNSLINIHNGQFKYLNLNDWYLYLKNHIDPLKPESINSFLRMEHWRLNQSKGIIYTYGGYGENRKDIWKNTYLKNTGGFIHLGIDINVEGFTSVKSPFDAYIVDRFIDKDTEIGWGGRLILGQYSSTPGVWKYPLLVLAHLDSKSLTKKSYVKKDEELGKIGVWPENGNTFCHLHVQCINDNKFKTFDGYGFEKELKDNPNPFEVEF